MSPPLFTIVVPPLRLADATVDAIVDGPLPDSDTIVALPRRSAPPPVKVTEVAVEAVPVPLMINVPL